jgi:hypothetical protein
VETPRSTGIIIHKNMNIESLNDEQLILVHTMLHMFYMNKNGRGLTTEVIRDLHYKVSKRLKKHEKFDGLDI